jgi:hypothetical protein
VDVLTRYTAEIGYLTAVDGKVLTLIRHTEDSIPMQVKPGWRVMASATAMTFTDIEKAVAQKADASDVPDVTGKLAPLVDTQDAAVASSAQAALVVHTSRTDIPH